MKQKVVFRVVFWFFVIAATVEFTGLASLIYLERYEVNLQTGEARESLSVLGVRVKNEIHSTWMSDLLTESAQSSKWVTVATFTLRSRRVSPHYRYHGALADLRHFEAFAGYAEIEDGVELKVAENIRELWLSTESYYLAGAYVQDVVSIPIGREEPQLFIADLPEFEKWKKDNI